MTNKAESDPHQHVRDMSMHLQETINRLRADIEKVDEPQLKAMFETSAEVLCGLKKAYSDYEQKKESAWPGGRARAFRAISRRFPPSAATAWRRSPPSPRRTRAA